MVLLLLSMILLSFSDINRYSKDDLYGVWEGVCHETEFTFTFNPDNACLLRFENKTSGEVNVLRGTFEADFSKDPIPLSINNIPQLSHGLYTIMEFNVDNLLMIADFAPRWRLRPVFFDHDTTMNLRRR